MRFMGLDVGEVRIGVAISDETGLIARALTTLQRTGGKRDFEALSALVVENEAGHVVVGHPVNMDGSQGLQAQRIHQFVESLKTVTRAPISLWDERLSSRSAEQVLIEGGVRRKKRRQVIDQLAAVIILQNFLDRLNASTEGLGALSTEDHGQE